MAKAQVLEVHGVAELVRKLSELPNKVENKILRQAMRAAGKPILAQAKANAPVSSSETFQDGLAGRTRAFGSLFGATEKQRNKAALRATKQAISVAKKSKQRYPGQLRDSLKLRAMKRKKGRIGYIVQSGKGDFRGDTYYAAFIEYGTSKMAAKAFMRPAFDTKHNEAESIIRRALIEGLAREGKP